MVKTTVYLESETALALREMARVEGRSQAELIREALSGFVRRLTRPRPKSVGRFRSGRSDISTLAEDLLKEAARKREL